MMVFKLKLKFPFSIWVCLLVVFCWLNFRSEASATYVDHICPNTATTDVYASNSAFRSNLNLLLSVLSSNSTVESGFYNATAGQSTNATAYGLFLCRGDLSPEACQECVSTATREVVATYCPREKRVVIWYQECMIRYSDQSIFSIVDRTYQPIKRNNEIEKDPVGFMRLLEEVMPDLATRAASGSGSAVGKKFAVAQTNYSALQTLYAMAQCTPDIPIAGCTTCLQDAISSLPNCCKGSTGVRILLPSCNVRYENFLFYNNTAFPPPPSPPTVSNSTTSGNGGIPSSVLIPIIVSVGVFILLFVVGLCFMRKKIMKKKKKYLPVRQNNTASTGENSKSSAGTNIITESWQFDLATIQAATGNFSDSNKLGAGGFGCVYKGILSNGNAIAVKRLSKSSRQGVEEFKNEAILVAKLQHRNLVRMLGYCLEGKEKILIYEYVPNRSLDYFLFDPNRKVEMEWSKRYKIIKGIARGVLYLHEDSQLKIIHRDLKASNILLDKDMNAKISDFGLARIFGVDQTQGNTSRVVGTYGYMSPEYVLRGCFSVKSDVFSLGVLMIEIISGKQNNNFFHAEMNSLLSYAWRLWKNGTPLEIVDPTLGQSYHADEVLRCLDIALSCVQDHPDTRPSMGKIVLMLHNHSSSMQAPQQPTFFSRGTMVSETSEYHKSRAQSSVNDLSVTEICPR